MDRNKTKIFQQDWFSEIRRPSRYLGHEINIVQKNLSSVDLSIVLAFPDVYEVGMSHQGLKILYHILNNQEWLAAERVFSPWIDLERALRSKNIPLTTLESKRPLSDFDIIGFSIQHELCFTNILTMLDLSGIPFLSSERDDSHPLIIAGGPACFNPEPIANLFDLIAIGDGEELSLTICRTLRKAKAQRRSKQEVLRELSGVKGIYIPCYFNIKYKPDGIIDYIKFLKKDYREVHKAILSDLDNSPFPIDQIVPFTQLIHDRLAIEIARGCTRGCRFCQAGMIYRPVRERKVETILKSVDQALKQTGFEEISLLSLSSGDYTCITPLLNELMNNYSSDKTAISFPSIRIDSLDSKWLEQIKRVRKTGFTMAPEAGNDRLRRLINKSLSNKDILDTAKGLYGSGWRLIKLYFMIGLPFEEEKDLGDIAELANRVSGLSGKRGDKIKLNISISTFVPKAHTPFMWTNQISAEEGWRRINLVRKKLDKNRRVRVKWNQPESSMLEGIFSRGDRRLTPALIKAWTLGARFDAWSDQLRMDIWDQAFQKTGIDPGFYLYRIRSLDEILPWEHIKCGVTKEYFTKEWIKATELKFTSDCRDKCLDCGVCNHKDIGPMIVKDLSPQIPIHLTSSNDLNNSKRKKYLLTFSKINESRFLSHLELSRLFIRAIKRAGLKMLFSEGYHPMPKISFLTALPVGTESLHESLVIELTDDKQEQDIKKAINHQLPENINIIKIEELFPGRRKLRVIQSHYRITLMDFEFEQSKLDKFLNSNSCFIAKNGKKGSNTIDVKELIKDIRILTPFNIELVVAHVQGPTLKPAELIGYIFGINEDLMVRMRILKTKQLVSDCTK